VLLALEYSLLPNYSIIFKILYFTSTSPKYKTPFLQTLLVIGWIFSQDLDLSQGQAHLLTLGSINYPPLSFAVIKSSYFSFYCYKAKKNIIKNKDI